MFPPGVPDSESVPMSPLQTVQRMLLLTGLCACLGCGAAAQVDEAARFDRQVETEWRVKWPWVDAAPFFERGGRYMDSDDTAQTRFDQPHVAPLLKALGEEFELHWHAMVEPKQRDFALAVLAELPSDPTKVDQIMAAIERRQQTFPGAILVQCGHRWLSLDFLTPEQEAFLEGTDQPPPR
jgi:hypothetical protein